MPIRYAFFVLKMVYKISSNYIRNKQYDTVAYIPSLKYNERGKEGE